MNKKYFAVEFLSGRQTTTGSPNPKTGNYSKAVNLLVFSDKKERDEWVSKGKITSDMRGNCREAVTKSEARNLKLGMTLPEFNEHIEYILDAHRDYDLTGKYADINYSYDYEY